MSKTLALCAAALAALLILSGCAASDGSRPRLAPASQGAGPTGFNGGYAGTNNGFSNLGTTSAPF